MGGEHAAEHYDVCIGPNLTCMNDLMNRMGQFDHVEYNGAQVKCRSNCEDQINSLFVTTSSYPNRKTLIYREEFCIVAKRLIEKCEGPKRKPLEREYPNLCTTLEPLTRLDPERFCTNNAWDIPRYVSDHPKSPLDREDYQTIKLLFISSAASSKVFDYHL
jgi:hypothetical protein